MITVITATGDRPECFELCQRWMAGQTVKPAQWLVIDDGDMDLPITEKMEYYKREKSADEPKHTLHLNLKYAIPFVRGDKIIIFEDDEYYSKNYIEVMSNKLNDFDLVGIGFAKYYHLHSAKWYRHENILHASLAQTAFHSKFLYEFEQSIEEGNNHFIDMRFWDKNIPNRNIFFDEDSLYCGIKGMPGRQGIGSGHNSDMENYHNDKDYSVLKQWIPSDYKYYLKLLEQKIET